MTDTQAALILGLGPFVIIAFVSALLIMLFGPRQ